MPAPAADQNDSSPPSGVRADPKGYGRQGAHKSWSQTTDRQARMHAAQQASPLRLPWHARRLGFNPDCLTEAQRQQAESARKAYFADLSNRSAKARRQRKATRLRVELAQIETEDADGGVA